MSEGLPLGPLPHVIDSDADASSQSKENDAQPNTGKRKAGKKLRSLVWKHFIQGPVGPDGAYDATCNYCGVKYQMGNQRSTGSLRHHYKRACQKMPFSKRHKPNALQKLLSAGTPSEPGLAPWEFSQMVSRKGLARMVVGHEYPFNCVSHHFFKEFIKELQPSFKFPSRNTLRADCLSVYAEEKVLLYEQLGRLDSKCSFTSDLWSNKGRDRGFLAITCHYIDSTWHLRKRVITFIPLASPHTGKKVADAISEQLVIWNLDKKMFSLVLDNSTVNDVCIREMLSCSKMCLKDSLPVKGTIFHQRCACHILNLIVQDGLAVLGDEIKSIRETMKYIRHSQGRMEKFSMAAKQAKAPSKKPTWDVPTRWNSTYKMLVLALELKEAIIRFGTFDKSYIFCPSSLDWENVQALTDCLGVFYEATLKLSGTHYPTLNLFFPEFCEVYLAIKKMENSTSPFIKEMGKVMFDKFDKYWVDANSLLAIACVLDPRSKLHVVEYYIKMLVPEDWQRFMSNVKACMNELFGEYLEAHNKLIKKHTRRENASASTSATDTRAGLKDFISGKKNAEPAKTELEEYFNDALDDAPLDERFEILTWWKMKAPKYPVLSKMVRDILAVPISTVASESVFSTSGRTLSSIRNALNNESMEALICAQNWLCASVREKGGEVGDPIWCSDDEDADADSGNGVGPDGA